MVVLPSSQGIIKAKELYTNHKTFISEKANFRVIDVKLYCNHAQPAVAADRFAREIVRF